METFLTSTGSPNPNEDKNIICVEFDDGDSGRIPMEYIRMLPPEFPIIGRLLLIIGR